MTAPKQLRQNTDHFCICFSRRALVFIKSVVGRVVVKLVF